ncbi:MAG: hypothetical protein AAF554_16265 [Bacteroidota bacterium]
MTREAFKTVLKEYLIAELQWFAPELKDMEIRAFDIGIFPWHGYVYLSFLPTKEYNRNGNHLYAGDWEYWNFNKNHNWMPMRFCHWMQENENIFDEEGQSLGTGYFKICGELLHDQDVLDAFRPYKLSPDFELLVFDQDEATRNDSTKYYLKTAPLKPGI